MKKRWVCRLVVWSLSVCLASCSISRNIKTSPFIEGMSESEYVEKVSLHQKGWETLSARLSLELDVDGRKTHKLAGSLRVKRGEVIQLSLAPVLGIEIGRAEITPDGLLVIDRMNKRYVQLAYSELEEFSHVDLSYELLQALVLNEMFVPGESAWNERDFDFL